MTESFKKQLAKRLKAFGIKGYFYYFSDRNRTVIPEIFSSCPRKWLNFYQAQQLYYSDPIINYAHQCIQPFDWQESIKVTSSKERHFIELAKDYFSFDGYSFVINDAQGYFSALNVTYEKQDRLIGKSFFWENRAVFQMLLIELHHLYLTEYRISTEAQLKVVMTKREKQVLELCSKGMKYSEIAAQLKIKERTVKFHMSNVVKKLGASSTKHALIKAKELALLP